jgi:hypothetical protein
MRRDAAQDDLRDPPRSNAGPLRAEMTPLPATGTAAPVLSAGAVSEAEKSEVAPCEITMSRDTARCARSRDSEGVECRRGPSRPAGGNGG